MKSTILTIAFAMIAGFALAADDAKPEKGKGKGAPDPEAIMKKIDTNADGKISKEEFAAGPMGKKASEKGGAEGVDKLFGRMDKNKDGSITKDELVKAPGKPKGEKKPKSE